MPAWVLPAITAAASLYGATQQAGATRDAADQSSEAARYTADMNRAIAEMNIAFEQGRFDESMAWAKLIREEEQLGYGDALQNQMYFDEDLGWQVLLSGRGQQIVDASARQDILNRTDLDRNNRERENRDAQFQRQEQLVASGNLDKYKNTYRQSESDLANLLYSQGQQGRNENLDRLGEQNNMIYSRNRGTSGFEQGQTQRAEQSAESAATAKIDAALRGKTMSRDIYNNDLNNASKQYFDFRNRSVQPWESSFMPTSVGMMNAPGTNGSNQMLSSALGQPTPEMPYISTDFSQANSTLANAQADAQMLDAWMGAATIGYGLYDDWSATQRQVGSDLDRSFASNPSLF
jgi:hypothetical protein